MNVKSYMLAATAGLGLMASAALADSIDPEFFEATLEVGESVTIKKVVTVAAGLPTASKVDVFFLSDTTGSMGGVINSVKTNAAAILAGTTGLGDVAWGVGEYKDFPESPWGGSSDFEWRLNTPITTDTGAVQDGIDLWSASGGFDTPESNLYALSQAASEDPAVGWRDDAARIIVWFGDATGHDPDTTTGYPGPTLADTIATLEGEMVTVIGVDSGNLDGTGQATAITTATDGSLLDIASSPSDEIVDLITDAIDETFSAYSMVSLSPSGVPDGVLVEVSDPIMGDFDREEEREFHFDVTFTGLEIGTYEFTIGALVDGGLVAVEEDRINVVPLPATSLLLLGGIGALGAMARRRRQAA